MNDLDKKLNLGCGEHYLDGFINLDYLPDIKVDVRHDLNICPYPFDNNRFNYVLADNILEHLDDTVKVMEELHRIIVDGGLIDIVVPYFASAAAFNDPTHKRFFSYTTFDYFTSDHPYGFYTKIRFEIVKRKLVFTSAKYGLFFKPISFLANKFPLVFQKFFCFMIPFNTLKVTLKITK